jgi:hypothetical protein
MTRPAHVPRPVTGAITASVARGLHATLELAERLAPGARRQATIARLRQSSVSVS